MKKTRVQYSAHSRAFGAGNRRRMANGSPHVHEPMPGEKRTHHPLSGEPAIRQTCRCGVTRLLLEDGPDVLRVAFGWTPSTRGPRRGVAPFERHAPDPIDLTKNERNALARAAWRGRRAEKRRKAAEKKARANRLIALKAAA